MPDVRVEVDAETADALQTECELLGFDGPEAYLAWIVENRAAIEQGTESAELLAAYRERVVALEARLDAAGIDPDAVDPGAQPPDSAPPSSERQSGESVPGEARPERAQSGATATTDASHPEPEPDEAPAADSGVADSTVTGSSAAGSSAADSSASDSSPATDSSSEVPRETADGATTAAGADAAAQAADDSPSPAGADSASLASDGTEATTSTSAEITAGTGVEAATAADTETPADTGAETTSSDDPAPADAASEADPSTSSTDGASSEDEPSANSDADTPPTPGAAASDGGTRTDADITSMHLRPERVQRVNEDPVARDAGELTNVTTKRVDEFSRRAVAETRQQLDRDVETGLSYDSSATMSSDVRPGEDLADLDAIEVPGRSEDLVAERREVVGRALAQLRDEGRARRSAFVDSLYEDHPAGYETADGWWRCVREGLSQVDAVDGGHVWEYVE